MMDNFNDDLITVEDNVSTALNIFAQTVFRNNKLVTMYGPDEYMCLIVKNYDQDPNMGHLKLRTKDMEAEWENVPVGFSQIDECESLFKSMKAASHVSYKRNSLWYVDQTLQDCVGEEILDSHVQAKNGKFSYRIELKNKIKLCLAVTKDMNEYRNNHEYAKLYALATENKEIISQYMTADECILLIANIAMIEDQRSAQFIKTVQKCGGRAMVSTSFRTKDEYEDESKAIFNNGYALTFNITNDVMTLEIYAKHEGDVYALEVLEFDDINELCAVTADFSKADPYVFDNE